jgi:hypothetical protein
VSGAQAGELQAEPSRPEEAAVYEAPAVLRLLWADPQYMPEHLALWSLKYFGPRAGSAVSKLRDSHPGADSGELEAAVIQHQTRVSMTEGAFLGGPFIVLLPVAFCAAMLAQAQMALELAALAGYAPDDEMRAADLLVIQGAYPSTTEASAALAKLTLDPKQREGKRLPRGTRINMIKRMAFMLGLLGSSDERRAGFGRCSRWAWSAWCSWWDSCSRSSGFHTWRTRSARAGFRWAHAPASSTPSGGARRPG